jgi:hypothetical protein
MDHRLRPTTRRSSGARALIAAVRSAGHLIARGVAKNAEQ